MNKRMKKQSRKGIKNKVLILTLSLVFVLSSNFLIGAAFPEHNAYNSEASEMKNTQKLYKSIQIDSGDTLWSIAKEYADENYTSVESYIDELVKINHLSSDRILEGQYLTIVYYS